MAKELHKAKEVFELMMEIRKFTRSSLILQHLISQTEGLNASDAECLDFLMEMGPSTAGALGKATGLTTGAITSLIDRLERSGFVKRTADPNDRRKVIVTLIPERKAVITAHYAKLAAAVQELLSTYNKKELDRMITHTRALAAVFDGQIRRLAK
ncbi:MAG TPA: MarR family transcriptional regulator [Puia sp.]|jgi:DNA-binding MarR family transcriptional regulator|nr:MarR family transcriptional regulator [Puia sp.]